jgi:PAS domain-containing protein
MATRRIFKPRPTGSKARRLAVLRRLLADIVESSGDAIFSRKLDGTVSTWNAAAERIFGYRARELIGQNALPFAGAQCPDPVRPHNLHFGRVPRPSFTIAP